jgi:hypothetical protein
MAAILLTMCGIFLMAYGTWRSWANGRELLLPAVHPGGGTPGRQTGGGPAESGPVPGTDRGPGADRPAWLEVRHAAWRLTLAIAWLVVAMLGLFMISVAGEVRA